MNDYAVRLLLLLPPTTADTHTFEQHALELATDQFSRDDTCEKRESVSVTVSYYAVFVPSPRLFPNKNDFLILMMNDKNRQQFDIIRPCWLRKESTRLVRHEFHAHGGSYMTVLSQGLR